MSKSKMQLNNSEISYEISNKFNDSGNKIDINIILPFSSMRTAADVKDCNNCPVGYMHHCKGKKNGCELNRVSVSSILREIADLIDVDEMIN